MKKIKLFAYIYIVSSLCVYSQDGVGVNIDKPEQFFHIDAMGNNTTLSSSKTDDFVVTKDGNVGIGTTTPTTGFKLDVVGDAKVSNSQSTTSVISNKLITPKIGIGTDNPKALVHIVPKNGNPFKFRLKDGSQSSGHLLTCDENGNAYWDALRPSSSIVQGALMSGVVIKNGEQVPTPITAIPLSLSPGKWLIVAKAATTGSLSGLNMYIRLYDERGRMLIQTGAQAESRNGSGYVATPSLSYMVSVPKKVGQIPGTPGYNTEFSISLISSNIQAQTTRVYGELPFYAIRIDRQD